VTDKQLTVNKMLSAENSRLQDELINLQKTLAVNRVAAQTDIDKLSGSLKDVITEKLRPVESYLQQTNDKVLSTGRDVIMINDTISQLGNRVTSEVAKMMSEIAKTSDRLSEKYSVMDDVAEVCLSRLLYFRFVLLLIVVAVRK
jgi:hypothetical protein